MPGFGDSPDLPEDVAATPPNIAAAVRDTLEGLGIEQRPRGRHLAGRLGRAGVRQDRRRAQRDHPVRRRLLAPRAGAAAGDRAQHGAGAAAGAAAAGVHGARAPGSCSAARWPTPSGCRPRTPTRWCAPTPGPPASRAPTTRCAATCSTASRTSACRSPWPGPTATARSTRPTSVPAGVEVRRLTRLRARAHVGLARAGGGGHPRRRRPGARRRRVRSRRMADTLSPPDDQALSDARWDLEPLVEGGGSEGAIAPARRGRAAERGLRRPLPRQGGRAGRRRPGRRDARARGDLRPRRPRRLVRLAGLHGRHPDAPTRRADAAGVRARRGDRDRRCCSSTSSGTSSTTSRPRR